MTISTIHASASPRFAVSFRYLDVLVIAVATAPALVLGAPAFGFLVGAGGWLLQRALQMVDRRLTARIDDSLQRAGYRLFESFGRIFLLAGAIVLAAAAGSHKDGLTAALVIMGAYSCAFVVRLISGPPPEAAR
jgi:hypothetical protein